MDRNIASRSAAFHARGCAVLLSCVAFALVLGVAALPGGTGRTAARPRTLATVRGSVAALAQEGRRIAWQCSGRVQILTLPGRRPVDIESRRGESCSAHGRIGLTADALSADGRVLWQANVEQGNTFVNWSVFTAALHDPRPRLAATAFFEIDPGNPDEPRPDRCSARQQPRARRSSSTPLATPRRATDRSHRRSIGSPAAVCVAWQTFRWCPRVSPSAAGGSPS